MVRAQKKRGRRRKQGNEKELKVSKGEREGNARSKENKKKEEMYA